MRLFAVGIIAAGLLLVGSPDAGATVFSGAVSYTNGAGPAVATNAPVSFSSDLSVGQSETFPDVLTFTSSDDGSGTGVLVVSFTGPGAPAGRLSACTFIRDYIILVNANPLAGPGDGQACASASPLPSGVGSIVFPSPSLDISFADGSKVRVAVGNVTLSGDVTVLGTLTLTLTGLADATPTDVREPGSIAVLATSLCVLGVRSRRKRGPSSR